MAGAVPAPPRISRTASVALVIEPVFDGRSVPLLVLELADMGGAGCTRPKLPLLLDIRLSSESRLLGGPPCKCGASRLPCELRLQGGPP